MDLGAESKKRSVWRVLYNQTSAIIFVIDSSNLERIDEAR